MDTKTKGHSVMRNGPSEWCSEDPGIQGASWGLPSWKPLRGLRVQTTASAHANHFSPYSFYSDVPQPLPTQFPFSIKHTRDSGRCSLSSRSFMRKQRRRRIVLLSCTRRFLRTGASRHAGIGALLAVCLHQAWLLCDARPMWRGLGPGKTHFPPLSSWKEDQGDLVTAQRFWACGQPHFPSISQAA